ncbi:dachshund homolog 2-like [Aulostomus maculatus]
MAGSCSSPLPRTSTPPVDPLFHSASPYRALNPSSSPRLPAARLPGAFLSCAAGGRVPFSVNATSGGAAPPPTECRMVEIHGVKVASFTVNGAELICLPQVFELFLRHLVGGLHTVYTKLKRLHISPVVCTVEQVRVLRGLGAIQPGVNRCKLITRADFETLYRDCTIASSRPGRPPKRALGVAMVTDNSRLLPHSLLSQTGLAAAVAMRMMMGFDGNSDQQRQPNGTESENDDTGGSEGSWEKDLSLISPSSSVVAPPVGPASLHLNTLHNALLANRLPDLPFMIMPHPLLPVGLPPASVTMAMNQMSQLSSFANITAMSQDQTDEDDSLMPLPLLTPAYEKLSLTSQSLSSHHAKSTFAPFLLAEGLSSMETLLTNIQGLLKVAIETVRSQDKNTQLERKELKLELEKERDARQVLQRQLSSELQTQASVQRRLKKEKKAKRKLQDALDLESRRRERVEQVIKHCDLLSDAASEREMEFKPQENAPGNRPQEHLSSFNSSPVVMKQQHLRPVAQPITE